MALVDVPTTDEEPHAVGVELDWGESYAFHAVDARQGLALRTRIGVRPNEGIMDVGIDVYLPDGGLIAMRHVAPQSTNTSVLEIEGACFTMLAPLERWRITYDGPAHALRSSRDAGSHDAWHRSRLERLSVDLEFQAHAPAAAGDTSSDRFGQAGQVSGDVWVSGDRYAIDTAGMRDKSWGAGSASIPISRRRLWARFGEDAAFAVDRRVMPELRSQIGWMLSAGRLRSVEQLELHTDVEEGSFWQRGLRAVLTDERGQVHEIHGEILHVAPMPIARGTIRAIVCDSVVRFRWNDREGHGFAEYVHRLNGAGQPVAPLDSGS
jgi:hypothetical protein